MVEVTRQKTIVVRNFSLTPPATKLRKIHSRSSQPKSFSILHHFPKSEKMAPPALQQRKTHNTLLFQKLLNLRDGASPFTLIVDTLEQGGGPVVREFAKRAKVCRRCHYASFPCT